MDAPAMGCRCLHRQRLDGLSFARTRAAGAHLGYLTARTPTLRKLDRGGAAVGAERTHRCFRWLHETR